MRAKRTQYAGIMFRSLLEAEFARHLTLIGKQWSYEPKTVLGDDGRRYTPDFSLEHKGRTIYFECKAAGNYDRTETGSLLHLLREPDPDCQLAVVEGFYQRGHGRTNPYTFAIAFECSPTTGCDICKPTCRRCGETLDDWSECWHCDGVRIDEGARPADAARAVLAAARHNRVKP